MLIAYANISSSTHSGQVWGFVSEPNGRGTFSIIWSCLAVLILNTWTVLHLNIPPKDFNPYRRYLHKTKWLIICAIVPDGLVVNAYTQCRAARKSVRDMKPLCPWWTLAHGFYTEMGGYKVCDDETGTQYVFRAAELAWLTREKVITIPQVSARDIHDRSNADGLAKGIACAQSIWFLAQIVARADQHLPMATLELATVAFIGCTWSSYFFWWYKPMDLETSTTIHVPRLPCTQLCSLAQNTCFSGEKAEWYRPLPPELMNGRWDYFWWEKPMVLRTLTPVNEAHQLPEDLRDMVKENFTAQVRTADWYRTAVNESHAAEWEGHDHLLVWIIGSAFNGIHCAAWYFHFPTPIEALLWKIAVCSMIGFASAWLPAVVLLRWLPDTSRIKSVPY
jgi:hypothetical protein